MDFVEVADRVWVARPAGPDGNVTAVLGAQGVLLVDTLGSAVAAERMLERLRRVTAAPLTAVVNTHHHSGHVLGNAAVRADSPQVGVICHEAAAAEMHGSSVVVPGSTFSSVRALDLGDRYVEVVHCGRGHTAGDAVVRVPDADLLVVGDLVAQGDHPSFGPDCWPLEWPATLEMVAQMATPGTVVVPGHGGLADRDLVHDQRADIGVVAETIRDLAGRGGGLQDALSHDRWPYPVEAVAHAVRRGYEHLPPTARRLPLA